MEQTELYIFRSLANWYELLEEIAEQIDEVHYPKEEIERLNSNIADSGMTEAEIIYEAESLIYDFEPPAQCKERLLPMSRKYFSFDEINSLRIFLTIWIKDQFNLSRHSLRASNQANG